MNARRPLPSIATGSGSYRKSRINVTSISTVKLVLIFPAPLVSLPMPALPSLLGPRVYRYLFILTLLRLLVPVLVRLACAHKLHPSAPRLAAPSLIDTRAFITYGLPPVFVREPYLLSAASLVVAILLSPRLSGVRHALLPPFCHGLLPALLAPPLPYLSSLLRSSLLLLCH